MYEGRSTCWLFENILTHPLSRLWCIDPFGAFDGIPGDYYGRFAEHTKPHADKIILSRDTSQTALRNATGGYAFAVIDGAHEARAVLEDAVLTWGLVRPGGVLIFDDYAWTGQGHEHCTEHDKPRMALDAFVEIYQPEVLQRGYQLIVRKP